MLRFVSSVSSSFPSKWRMYYRQGEASFQRWRFVSSNLLPELASAHRTFCPATDAFVLRRFGCRCNIWVVGGWVPSGCVLWAGTRNLQHEEQPLSISQTKAVLHAPRKESAYKRRQPKNRFEASCGRCLSPSHRQLSRTTRSVRWSRQSLPTALRCHAQHAHATAHARWWHSWESHNCHPMPFTPPASGRTSRRPAPPHQRLTWRRMLQQGRDRGAWSAVAPSSKAQPHGQHGIACRWWAALRRRCWHHTSLISPTSLAATHLVAEGELCSIVYSTEPLSSSTRYSEPSWLPPLYHTTSVLTFSVTEVPAEAVRWMS